MSRIDELKVRMFMDGAEIDAIRKTIANSPYVAGFTTNPTLMRKARVKDYAAFAIEAIGIVGQRSISFEVFADDFGEMEREAHIIHSWGGNTYVKIPITNTKGDTAAPLIRKLSAAGVPLNVTAILTHEQIRTVADALDPDTPSIVSVFAGRIADTGVDPVPMMQEAKAMLRDRPKAELLWASCRELLNIIHADGAGCDIITIPNDILSKLPLLGRDLKAYSLETVKMFFDDALAAGFRLR